MNDGTGAENMTERGTGGETEIAPEKDMTVEIKVALLM